ncbi:MAG TPA: fibronectin type III domain-containing protein [Solirubrobacterales bacterium]
MSVSLAALLIVAGIAAANCWEPAPCETPGASTEAATLVDVKSAKLNGTVDPNGCQTSYEFKYRAQGESFWVSAGGGSAGSEGPQSQSAFLFFLKPATKYEYFITADNGEDPPVSGKVETFTTKSETSPPPPPEVPSATTEAATGITHVKATLNGSVNPHGLETEYKFEYTMFKGLAYQSTSYLPIGSGTTNQKVSAEVELLPGVTYYFRITAKNKAGQSSPATELSFSTPPLVTNWTIQAIPEPAGAQSSRLTSGSCTASNACTSAGSYVNSSGVRVPLAERWNGSAWSAQTPPAPAGATTSELRSVSCVAITWCAAVGTSRSGGLDSGFAEVWNGSEWTLKSVPAPSGATQTELSGISCTSSTACTAVGLYRTSSTSATFAARWNGVSWAVQSTPNPIGATGGSLLGVSCTSGTACTAVGYYYNSSGTRLTLAESWNGSVWSIQTTPNRTGATQNILLGVSCSAANACTAVGGDFPAGGGPQETLAERWNGTAWSIQSSVNHSSSQASVLEGVSCLVTNACTAVGSHISGGVNLTLAERWINTSWALLTTPNPTGATFSSLRSVACASLSECIAPGHYKTSAGVERAMIQKSW